MRSPAPKKLDNPSKVQESQLLTTALGNNTVEIVDQWKRVHAIDGLEHPQPFVYLPTIGRIAMSSQSGKLRFYDASTYALVKTLDFGANTDADKLRYDAGSRLPFVGVGESAATRSATAPSRASTGRAVTSRAWFSSARR